MKERLAPLVQGIFGEGEAVGDVENFTCLYMTKKKHRAQQWHIDMRSDERLLVFVGLEDQTARVEFFSESFPETTRTVWGGLRAGNVGKGPTRTMEFDREYRYLNKGDREVMRSYADALELRRGEEEQAIGPKLNAGDVLVAFANLLHRSPRQEFVAYHPSGLWKRLVGFGTISKLSAPAYTTLDQCVGALCTANVHGVASRQFAEEVDHIAGEEQNCEPLTVFDNEAVRDFGDKIAQRGRKRDFASWWKANGGQAAKRLKIDLNQVGSVTGDDDEAWEDFAEKVNEEVRTNPRMYNSVVIKGVQQALKEKLEEKAD